MINGHGDDIQTELIANFSSNVWYGADNSAMYQHLSAMMPNLSRYPEADAHSLKVTLAAKNTIEASQILVCNGSTEAFYLIANAFSGKKSLIVTPTFAEYADACRIHRHKVYQCSRHNLQKQIETQKPHLVWICNPNNPDGYCYTQSELTQLLTAHPQITFVIDQAYREFSTIDTNMIPNIQQFNNLIVVQSLTKRFAILGLRLGYIVSSQSTIKHIRQYKMPWSVNTLAIEAGKFIMDINDDFNIDTWLCEKNRFQDNISRIGIFEVFPTNTPFFLAKLLRGNAADLKAFLLTENILIRNANNFGYGHGEFIRINTLSESENNLLIEKLVEWKNTL